ncbi:hypothetical protein Hanom_Chr11g01034671 [Helianthus anomalus]
MSRSSGGRRCHRFHHRLRTSSSQPSWGSKNPYAGDNIFGRRRNAGTPPAFIVPTYFLLRVPLDFICGCHPSLSFTLTIITIISPSSSPSPEWLETGWTKETNDSELCVCALSVRTVCRRVTVGSADGLRREITSRRCLVLRV